MGVCGNKVEYFLFIFREFFQLDWFVFLDNCTNNNKYASIIREKTVVFVTTVHIYFHAPWESWERGAFHWGGDHAGRRSIVKICQGYEMVQDEGYREGQSIGN